MSPISPRSVRPPFATIEDRLSVYDRPHARSGSLKSNGLPRTQFAAQRRKESLMFYSKKVLLLYENLHYFRV
jgi:hypothetical protein